VALVLVDFDGTLLTGPSSEKRFFIDLLRRGRIGPRQLTAFLRFTLRWRRRWGGDVWKKNKAYLAGLAEAEVEDLARALALQRLVPDLFPPMVRRLEAHRVRGDEVLLLTGTLDCIARPMAAHLGILHLRATRCAVSGGRLLGDPPLEHPLGAAKVRIATEEARRRGLPLEEATAYGDASEDLALLTAVGRPVAVRPHPRLRREAIRRGWAVLEA
jgi:HAD superfamily hydrolase (TIGR01490 family)